MRSFMDANADGVGDLPGVVQRLDYLAWLGIGMIWLTPFYPSPMRDHGYDVAGFCDVDPRYGTLAGFGELVCAAHARGLRVLIDICPNHTSSDHPWFRAARSSRDNPLRDYYIWRDPAPGGGPPNNWLSHSTGGPAWTFDENSQGRHRHARRSCPRCQRNSLGTPTAGPRQRCVMSVPVMPG